jgi:hypothetical protein
MAFALRSNSPALVMTSLIRRRRGRAAAVAAAASARTRPDDAGVGSIAE